MLIFKGFVLCLGVALTVAIPKEVLYPFGDDYGDSKLPPSDDVSSEEIQLQVPIAFFDEFFRSIYVNINGHMSFGTELPIYKPDLVLPFGFKVIAPYLSDVDTRLSGNVYYRESRDPSLLEMAARELHQNFPRRRNFQPRALFIVTWEAVGYYKKAYDPTNTFQVVIASDGVDSFAMFLYPQLNWVKSLGKESPSLEDIPAQVGFDSGDYRQSFLLPGSGNIYVRNLAQTSNTGAPGVWMFRIGNLQGQNIEDPGANSGSSENAGERPSSCSAGGDRLCNANGQCTDYEGGYCCECQSPFVGNGINCVQPEIQMRVNGKVSGTINGITLDHADLHAFLMFKDGRDYIAISRVNPELGLSLQGLFTFAGGLGWLLAVPSIPNAKNGYTITGGDFNRTAIVTFLDLGQSVRIEQHYTGQNAEGHMEMHSVINGNIPTITEGAEIVVPDYQEEYRRQRPGVIKSFSSHTYTVDGVPIHFSVDQTLNYNECPFKTQDMEEVQSLDISRTFIHFDNNEQKIVRFAQSNKFSSGAAIDPCLEGAFLCDSNADCVPDRDTYRCLCKQGYQGDGETCQDVDECSLNTHDCHQFARCYNNLGSFECRCQAGYSGNGRDCRRDITCADLNCDHYARCIYDSLTQMPKCECNSGYQGDGMLCDLIEFDCSEVNNCDENAECVFDRYAGRYECQCNDGFSGDGTSCTDTGEAEIGCQSCDQHAGCVYDVYLLTFICQCNPGYSGDGRTCYPLEIPSTGCETLRCDPNANCAFDEYESRYTCQCNPGFQGDGYVCQRTDDCSLYNYCDRNARCLPQPGGFYSCVCNDGFEGDGRICREASCNVINNCDINADCLYEPISGRYQCQCRQGYSGDGFACRLSADCRRDPRICDANARCENRGYDYICVCNPGYRGDGYRCAPLGDKESYLMAAQGMTIIQLPFTPSEQNPGKPVLSIPGQTAIGIDVDCFARYFYWTDVAGRVISKAQLDGTDSQVLIQGLGSPEGVAIDWITGNMYWTDSGLDRIEMSKTDGTGRKALIYQDLVDPRGIVVDPVSGVMFWTDWNRKGPKIEKANMDGKDRTILVETELGLPNGLTIDFQTHHICWVDAGTKKIECINYAGADRRTIYSHADYPFDITYTSHVFYWTDWHKDQLQSINKFAPDPNEGMKLPDGGQGRTYGIAVVKSQCPAGTNACALNNGGCRFICLPTPNGGRTCDCPDDIDQDECNRIGKLKKI